MLVASCDVGAVYGYLDHRCNLVRNGQHEVIRCAVARRIFHRQRDVILARFIEGEVCVGAGDGLAGPGPSVAHYSNVVRASGIDEDMLGAHVYGLVRTCFRCGCHCVLDGHGQVGLMGIACRIHYLQHHEISTSVSEGVVDLHAVERLAVYGPGVVCHTDVVRGVRGVEDHQLALVGGLVKTRNGDRGFYVQHEHREVDGVPVVLCVSDVQPDEIFACGVEGEVHGDTVQLLLDAVVGEGPGVVHYSDVI